MNKNLAKRIIGLLFISILLFSGCGKQKAQEEIASKDTISSGILDAETFRETYMYSENTDYPDIPQQGNQMVNGVELNDAVAAPEDGDPIWQGYTEFELGFLAPGDMPCCQADEQGRPCVTYEGVTYTYMNSYFDYSDAPAGVTQYANVWISWNDEGAISVLGGHEEYGLDCAQKAGTAE